AGWGMRRHGTASTCVATVSTRPDTRSSERIAPASVQVSAPGAASRWSTFVPEVMVVLRAMLSSRAAHPARHIRPIQMRMSPPSGVVTARVKILRARLPNAVALTLIDDVRLRLVLAGRELDHVVVAGDLGARARLDHDECVARLHRDNIAVAADL